MRPKIGRVLLLAAALLTLVLAMWAGLLRFLWGLPVLPSSLVAIHGPLMISGFLGTLIGLERAVGLNRPWAYSGPAFTALGALAFVAGLPEQVGIGLMTLGSLGVVAIFAVVVQRHMALYTITMALGAGSWFVGNLLWLLGGSFPNLVAWWMGFLVLTIAGERLELTRILRIFSTRSKAMFGVAVGLFFVGAVIIPFDFGLGWRVTGAAMLGQAVWLVWQDAARQMIRKPELTGFVAACLFLGYIWLGVAGVIALSSEFLIGGAWDATLHSVFLGFVISMIFGHAPIIFPSVLGLPIRYRPILYAPLVLLHLSVVLRVGAGLLDWLAGRQWGGMLNSIAILVFMFNTATDVLASRKEATASQG